MYTYELMIVVKPDFPQDDALKQKELVYKLLTDQDPQDVTVEFWGKKKLAYEIDHQADGVFLLARFASNTVSVAKIEQQKKLNDTVLRFLLTRIPDEKK